MSVIGLLAFMMMVKMMRILKTGGLKVGLFLVRPSPSRMNYSSLENCFFEMAFVSPILGISLFKMLSLCMFPLYLVI